MEDITGQRFGRFTALPGLVGRQQPVRRDCGTTKSVYYYNLIKHHTVSCGCLKKFPRPQAGDRFGNLTATGVTVSPGLQRFTCSCGRTATLRVSNVRIGLAASCEVCAASTKQNHTVMDDLFYRGISIAEHARRQNIKPKDALMRILRPPTADT